MGVLLNPRPVPGTVVRVLCTYVVQKYKEELQTGSVAVLSHNALAAYFAL